LVFSIYDLFVIWYLVLVISNLFGLEITNSIVHKKLEDCPTMTYSIIPDDEALSSCACCRREITDETDIIDLGIQVNPNIDLSDYESHCIEIELTSESQPVHMLVAAAHSDAKQEGKDGLFLLCSQTCADSFKRTLQNQIDQGKIIRALKD
jgi:hypothetical protein